MMLSNTVNGKIQFARVCVRVIVGVSVGVISLCKGQKTMVLSFVFIYGCLACMHVSAQVLLEARTEH